MREAWQYEVVGVTPAAGQQARIFGAWPSANFIATPAFASLRGVIRRRDNPDEIAFPRSGPQAPRPFGSQ